LFEKLYEVQSDSLKKFSYKYRICKAKCDILYAKWLLNDEKLFYSFERSCQNVWTWQRLDPTHRTPLQWLRSCGCAQRDGSGAVVASTRQHWQLLPRPTGNQFSLDIYDNQ
jgi:hypothetical protein